MLQLLVEKKERKKKKDFEPGREKWLKRLRQQMTTRTEKRSIPAS